MWLPDLIRTTRKRLFAQPPSVARENVLEPAPASPACTVDWRRQDESGAVEKITCFENRGILIPVVPGLFSDHVTGWISAGSYEMHEASVLDSLIEPGEIILEIGAGCGFISAYCAKDARTRAVYCVEANPSLIEVIKLTHQINAVNVTVYSEILAREAGETDFFLHKDFWASGTHRALGTPIKVKTVSFQDKLMMLRPTLLIVDIEGGEDTLFEGIELTGVRKIMIELHQDIIGRRGIKKVFDTLSAQNFHYETWHSAHSVVTLSHVDRG